MLQASKKAPFPLRNSQCSTSVPTPWYGAKAYFNNDANGATPPPTPGTAGTANGATYDNVCHSMGSGTPNQSMPCPPSNLVWAIVSTILCCLPTGIVAIVYACKVDNLYLMGDYQGAVEASNKARNWALGGLIASIVFYFVYILVLLSVGFGSIASMSNL